MVRETLTQAKRNRLAVKVTGGMRHRSCCHRPRGAVEYSAVTTPLAANPWLMPAIPVATLPPEVWSDRLWTALGTALDRAVVEAMRRVIDAVVMPSAADLPALRAAAAPFTAGPLWEAPSRFFAFLDRPPDAVVSETRYRRRLRGGMVIGRRFAGRYQPYAANTPPDHEADAILLEHWMHERTPPHATVLALHGFSMGQPRIDALALFARQWFRRGLDVVLLTLPYHGARTPASTRFSGMRFADANPAVFNEAVRRALYDMHVVRGWLREQTGLPVGLLGLSLGGYLVSPAPWDGASVHTRRAARRVPRALAVDLPAARAEAPGADRRWPRRPHRPAGAPARALAALG